MSDEATCSCNVPETVLTPKDFRSSLKPIWCPGCGDYGVVSAVYRALANIGRPPHEIAFISGIGCSSRIPGYTTAYGFNTVHGRALPIAQGIKMASPDLLVLATDLAGVGGRDLPLDVSATDSYPAATDAPERSLRIVAHQRVSLIGIRRGEEVPCDTLTACLAVSRYLLEQAVGWLD